MKSELLFLKRPTDQTYAVFVVYFAAFNVQDKRNIASQSTKRMKSNELI